MNSSLLPGYVMIAVGGVMVGIGGFWGIVIGYYPSDLPLLVGLLAVGALLLWLGQRKVQTEKRREVEQGIASRDNVRNLDGRD